MTGAEFAKLIERTGWSARAVAKRFNISHGTVHDMKIGRMSPDPVIVRYLQGVADAIARVPMPPLPLPDRRYRD
jgi:transcriptional regulator with XRE-family HTH domain